jgi:ATP-dependent Clp protease adaptor protein ClpS
MGTAPVVIEKEKIQVKERYTPRFKVLLHNDDVHDMIYVSLSLQEIFKWEAQKALQTMLEAHKTGVALCVIEPQEVAELRQNQLQSKGLTSTIEPE